MLMVRKYSLLRRASGNRRNRLLGYCLRECSSGVKCLTKNEMTDVFTFQNKEQGSEKLSHTVLFGRKYLKSKTKKLRHICFTLQQYYRLRLKKILQIHKAFMKSMKAKKCSKTAIKKTGHNCKCPTLLKFATVTQHGGRGWHWTNVPNAINAFITNPAHERLYHTNRV